MGMRGRLPTAPPRTAAMPIRGRPTACGCGVRSARSGRIGRRISRNLAVLDPGLAPEDGHAAPGQQRIRGRQPRDIGGHGGARKHQLSPGNGEQQPTAGHTPRASDRVAPGRGRVAAGQDSIEPVGPIEHAPPRVDHRPEIADEGGKGREPDPPDDPHQRRGNVAIGILVSAKSGCHGQNEYAGGYQLEQRQETGWASHRPSG